jgi:hypothetical protein
VTRVSFAQEGLGYVMHVPELAVEINVRRLIRSRGDLHGDLRVQCGLPGTKSTDGHIHQARFNLSSTQARNTVAKALAARATLPDLDWADLLEEFCRRVMGAEEIGAPTIMVGTMPRSVQRSYRIEPVMPLGDPVILYGEGGTGKSTLAAALAVSVQTGVVVVDGFIPRRANVLYLDWESGPEAINERVALVAAGVHLPEPVQIRYRAMARPLPEQAEDLAAFVAREDIGLVIVDSVGLASGIGDGGDAAETAWRLFSAFRVLRTTVLAVDHIAKSSADEQARASRPYGSIYKTNLARATYELRRHEAGGQSVLGLYCTKYNDRARLAPMAIGVTHEPESISYQRLDELPEELTRPLRLSDRIAAVLAFQALTTKEIADLVQSTEGVVAQTMRRDGKRFTKQPTSGRWEVVGKEASRASA